MDVDEIEDRGIPNMRTPVIKHRGSSHALQEFPDAGALHDRTPEALQASRNVAGFAAIIGGIYCYLSYRILWHTDIWGHLAYGRWIWNNGSLPTTEPLMPLASGVPFVDSAWLSQLIGYAGVSLTGTAGLQFLYAASIATCAGLLLWCCFKRTRNTVLSVAGLGVAAWVDWQQLKIVRPQLSGLVCFMTLFALLLSADWSRWKTLAVGLLFVAWANLHGSFPVGLALIAGFALGRAIDLARRLRDPRPVWRDVRFRRFVLLLLVATAATLVNPYGPKLHAAVVSILQNPNVADLVEWKPLHLRMSQGQAFAATAVLLIVVYRFSPRRVSATEFLLLVGFGIGSLWTSRIILWWAPLAAYYLVLHASAVWDRRAHFQPALQQPPRSGRWTVVAVGIAWVCFAFTPFASSLFAELSSQGPDKQPELYKKLSKQTPLGAAEYLQKHPPQGQIFNTLEWGDFLLWKGPADLQVFVASHVHLLPPDVWRDYLLIIGLTTGWQERLDAYGVNAIVVDHAKRKPMISRLQRDRTWRIVFDNQTSAVFVRNRPL